MLNKKNLTLGIICALCLVFIILGALAGVSIYKIFATENEVYGDSCLNMVPQYARLNLENPEVFFEYTISGFSFEQHEGVKTTYCGEYFQTFVFNALDYDNNTYNYNLFVGENHAETTKMKGQTFSYLPVTYYKAFEGNVTFDILFDVVFYSDRTQLTVSYNDVAAAGYLNKMAETGLTITIVRSTATTKPVFIASGTFREIIDGNINTYSAIFDMTNCVNEYQMFPILIDKSWAYSSGYNEMTSTQNDLINYFNIWPVLSATDMDASHVINLAPSEVQTVQLELGKAYALIPKNSGNYSCNLYAGCSGEEIFNTFGTYEQNGYKTGSYWIMPSKSGNANAESFALTKTVYFSLETDLSHHTVLEGH